MVADELSPPPKRVKKTQAPPPSFGKEIENVPPVADGGKGKGKALVHQDTFMEVDACEGRGRIPQAVAGASSVRLVLRTVCTHPEAFQAPQVDVERLKASCEEMKDQLYEEIIQHYRNTKVIDVKMYEKMM
jgi:hypothetical protein